MANHENITRRAFAATLAAAIPAAAVAAPATVSEHSEHEQLLSRYRTSVAEFLARPDLSEEESLAFADQWRAILNESFETPVKSARDLRAQFKLVQEHWKHCDLASDGEAMSALNASIERLVRMESA